MSLPTLLFRETKPKWFEATEDVPNRIIYRVLPGHESSWIAGAYAGSDPTRKVGLGYHPDLDAAFKACESHFLRQRPA